MIDVQVTQSRRSPTVTGGMLPVKLQLAGGILRVNAGTPLRPRLDGTWEVAKNGLGEFVSAESKYGGESAMAWRSAIVDLHVVNRFMPGLRYNVTDVDDTGFPEFTPDPSGIYLAVSGSAILMDMSIAALHLRAAQTLKAPE